MTIFWFFSYESHNILQPNNIDIFPLTNLLPSISRLLLNYLRGVQRFPINTNISPPVLYRPMSFNYLYFFSVRE